LQEWRSCLLKTTRRGRYSAGIAETRAPELCGRPYSCRSAIRRLPKDWFRGHRSRQLGAERVSKNDVGEIRRVLNSLLQFLESESSDSLIVGATNHSRLLDRALFRRFDAVIDYCLPSKEIAEEIMRSRLALLDTSAVEWKTASKASESLSHAEIVRACEQAAKDAILRGSLSIHTESLASALDERRAAHGDRT